MRSELRKLPPGPRLPAIAQAVQFAARPLPWLEECLEKYGDPFTLRFPGGMGAYILVTAPELIREIFNGDAENLHAGKANAIVEPVVGKHSVLLLDGEPHLRERRRLSPPMRGERMHAYAQVMAEIARAELARMPRGRPFAIHEHTQSITLDVILRAVFGLDGANLRQLRAELIELLEPPPPYLVFLPPKYLDFPLSPYRAFLRKRDAADRSLRLALRARVAAPTGGDDVLSLMLGMGMSEDELRDELMTLLVAGHETTATALSWAFALLLEHPAALARLVDELAPVTDPAGYATLDYLDAVVKETLRIRPVIPDVVRQIQRPMRFAGHDLPAGVNLTPCIHLAHRRADAFPDPAAFKPERWLGVKVDPYTWFPFGGGIRRCLGQAFAMYEMKLVLGTLLSKARFRLAESGTVRSTRRGITIAPKGGTRVILHS
jgi:cytochrome P450